MFVEETNVQ
jgi:hypothetical protein